MQGRAGRGQQLTAARQIKAVIRVPAVRRAAPHPHQPASTQPAQVVGDQVLRLAEQDRQLTDLPVTAGQLTQQPPAQRFPGQPQEPRRRLIRPHAHLTTVHQAELIDQYWLIDRHPVRAARQDSGTGQHRHPGTSPLPADRKESGLLDDNGGVLIVLHGADRVGMVDWHKVPTGRAASSWAIGIGLASEFRGRGYGSEAQQLLVRYLFAHTPVNRVEATTEIANVAEQRALEKAGFTREGVLRGRSFRLGRYRDNVIYSVLRDEVKLGDPGSEDGTV
jgi:RimJ/RimL family protein N-acetyltransferase